MKRKIGEGPHYVYYLYDAKGDLADIGRSVEPAKRKLIKERKHGEVFTMKVSRPIVRIEDACNRERSELKKYKPRLSKRVVSAKGCFGKTFTCERTPEHTAKLTGPGNGMYNRQHTKAAKKAMSVARKGVPFTVEHLANLAAANKSDKRRKEVSLQKKGKPLSAKNLRGIRKALKKPEVRTKMSEAHKGKKTSPEVVVRIAAANTGQKRTAKQRARMCAAQHLYYAEKKLLQSGYGHPWRLKDLDELTREVVG